MDQDTANVVMSLFLAIALAPLPILVPAWLIKHTLFD